MLIIAVIEVMIRRIVMIQVFETMAKKGLETLKEVERRKSAALKKGGCCCTIS